MGRSRKALAIVHPEGRHYACRDCAARCCTSSWGIPVSKEECDRIMGDDEARSRLGPRGEAILRAGVLPMREQNERLACVFLDADQLCSLHKRHGHEFIPAPCQAYPFGFSQNEEKKPVALLSRYCPSIRDNYGDPVEQVIQDKWLQAGAQTAPMAEKMGLRSGRVLPRAQYVRVVKKWQEILDREQDPAVALARAYDFIDRVDEALPKNKKPNDQEFAVVLSAAEDERAEGLVPGKLTFGGRMLVAHLLGGICYPSRVMLAHRMTPVRFLERVASWMNRLAWLFGLGRVKLLFVERPVSIRRARDVPPFLSSEIGRLVSDYLLEVLERRQGMIKQTYLSRVVVDLALMTVLISRYARAAASTEGGRVEDRHVKEGIGIAELLFSHQGDSGQSTVLHQLRLALMANREDYRRLLAGEVMGSGS